MNWSAAARDILVFAVIGAVVGLVLGLVLAAIDVVSGPFAFVALGIAVGAALSITMRERWARPTP
ncbi:MAG: hypothetical protein S0880_22870 [Actinomycetota bacterium]|nr:hypothetical protein [Actinomycetota bacterium]